MEFLETQLNVICNKLCKMTVTTIIAVPTMDTIKFVRIPGSDQLGSSDRIESTGLTERTYAIHVSRPPTAPERANTN